MFLITHELKSPIQPIMGFAELAKSGDIDQNEAWDGVTQLAKKLQDLANDVLDVSKIENKQLRLNKESTKVNELISDVVNSFRINIKNITLQENYDENIEIEVDRMRFDQVMRNILTNAIKFTPKGEIKVSTQICFSVSFEVIGILNSNVAPPLSLFLAEISPSCASIIPLHKNRPNPVPL